MAKTQAPYLQQPDGPHVLSHQRSQAQQRMCRESTHMKFKSRRDQSPAMEVRTVLVSGGISRRQVGGRGTEMFSVLLRWWLHWL